MSWLAREVRAGKIRWVLADQGGAGLGGGLPGDTRTGLENRDGAVAKACKAVTLPSSAAGSESAANGVRRGSGSSSAGTLYDCQGRAAALAERERATIES